MFCFFSPSPCLRAIHPYFFVCNTQPLSVVLPPLDTEIKCESRSILAAAAAITLHLSPWECALLARAWLNNIQPLNKVHSAADVQSLRVCNERSALWKKQGRGFCFFYTWNSSNSWNTFVKKRLERRKQGICTFQNIQKLWILFSAFFPPFFLSVSLAQPLADEHRGKQLTSLSPPIYYPPP